MAFLIHRHLAGIWRGAKPRLGQVFPLLLRERVSALQKCLESGLRKTLSDDLGFEVQ